ncbi:radical SAM protein [Candidatus Woesearchaeota archaeon]|nr:radical SAM protein [Candidatus Woesearchaeota archaeon]
MNSADIKLGYSCNNNCIHCVITDQKKNALKTRGNQDRTTEEYKKELYNSRINGCTSVTFTGGEPTLRKDLLELLNYAKSLGFRINMQTNGRAFYYKKFAERFTPFNITYTIALHGHTAEMHESITRSKESFGQTFKGIKNLVELKQKIWGKVVISKKNYKNLKNISKMFIDLGILNMNFAFPHAQGNAWKHFDKVVPKYTKIKKYIHETIDYVEFYNKNITLSFETIPFCFMVGYEKYVSELKFKGNKHIELKQLDGKTKDWQKIRLQIKSKFKQCKKCKYDSICEGPWKEYPKKYGIREFSPVS